MDVKSEIDTILADDSLDDESRDEGKCDLIEALIPRYGWESVQGEILAVLEDNNRRHDDCLTGAAVLWGAVLDERDIQVDRVIALLYHRLEPNSGSGENNLAWSIVCKLKGVDYLSEYNPLEDAGVKVELENIRRA